MHTRSLILAVLMTGWLTAAGAAPPGAGRYVGADEFLHDAFDGSVPSTAVLWLDRELRTAIEDVLGHRFEALRIRYWRDRERSAWIFDEIGKEQPITIGVTVTRGAIENVRVLEFRETRGWEVRYPFFTDQFSGARLADRGRIDRDIDGITGATLSVAAVTRVVELALMLHGKTELPHS